MPSVTLDFAPAKAEETLKEIFDYLDQSGKECFEPALRLAGESPIAGAARRSSPGGTSRGGIHLSNLFPAIDIQSNPVAESDRQGRHCPRDQRLRLYQEIRPESCKQREHLLEILVR